MNKLKKTLALVATLAIASTAFVACNDDSKPADSSSKPADSSSQTDDSSKADEAAVNKFKDDDKTLSILCWSPDDITKMIENFTDTTGKYGDVTVEYVNVGSKGQEAREQYVTYFAGDKDVDLFVLEADWILEYIDNDDYTAPITDLGFKADDFKGNYAYTLATGTNANGVLKGVSWQATPGAYVYRTDLAEQYLGVKSSAEMQEKVKDWDTLLATAKTVKEASDGKCAVVDTLGGLWQVYSYNRTQAWVDSDDKLVVDDYCKEYADIAKTLWDEGYVTKEGQWTDGWNTIGPEGKTLGYFFCTWCLGKGGMLETVSGGMDDKGTPGDSSDDVPKNPDLYGKYDICAGPSFWAWGGSWLAVSPKCNTGSAAHDFVNYFTVDEKSMEEYALFKGEFVNNPTVMKKIVDDKSNKNAMLGGNDQFAVLYDSASKIDMDGKITAYDAQIKDAFNKSIESYVKGEKGYGSYDEMITEFKKKAAAIEGITVE
ncbi:MAG: ABC transporter substrate-binding protein [Oscillospiraceae bacterium]|nr:ABC transporter substrate-binding protein [Oscillospiraceae bacterium]